jgi:hypothetical protein
LSGQHLPSRERGFGEELIGAVEGEDLLGLLGGKAVVEMSFEV